MIENEVCTKEEQMSALDMLNAKEVIDSIRQDCERELASGQSVVVRQEWLEFDERMIYIHAVHSRRLTILTIGIPLPECPMDVTDSFSEAQHVLEAYYALSRAEE
jgi:hypothetical protein